MKTKEREEFESGIIHLMDKLEMTSAQTVPVMISMLMSMIDTVTQVPAERKAIIDQVHETLTRKLITEGGRLI